MADQWSDSQRQGIISAFNQYQNDPATLQKLMQETGINSQQIADVLGKPQSFVNSAVTGTQPAGGGRDWSWATDAAVGGGNVTKPMEYGGGSGYPTAPSGFAGSAGGGMGSPGGGMSTAGASSAGQNPYLQKMGDAMVGQMTTNFNRNVMPAIASGAVASGNYGGSRQGVIEANAMNDLNLQAGNALTNLYGGGFNTALNYDLGLRGNDLGWAGLDSQINQQNFNNNLAGAQFGLGLWNQGMANNQTGINSGTNIQNTPMNYWSQFGNQYNSIGNNFASNNTSTNQQGNPVMGALGGAQLGSQIGNWWGSSPNAAGGSNSQGWGTGSGFGNMDYGSFI